METDVLDPAAQHDELDTMPAPELPDELDQGEPLDEYGPPVFTLELHFESGTELADAQAVWRKANELIESARAKGLNLHAGQVFRQDGGEPTASDDKIARALMELDAVQRQEAAASE